MQIAPPSGNASKMQTVKKIVFVFKKKNLVPHVTTQL